MPDSSGLTLHTIFPPEVDISTLRLTSRIVWPAEASPIITSSSHMVDRHAESETLRIPKPKGVVGRIKEGGYSLFKVLRWEREQYNAIQAYVRMQAAVHCDTRLNYQSQSEDAVSRVCHSVRQKYNFMDRYEGHWVTKDFLMVYLSNSKSYSRKTRGLIGKEGIGELWHEGV